jgi:HSP20 family protein
MSQTLPERRRASTPERWEPFTEFEQVTERMRRLLEQTFGGFGSPGSLATERGAWSPLVDLDEEDDASVIEAELPGVKPEDVNIELVGNELMITGELKQKERKGTVRRQTRRTGRFDYRVSLPSHVDSQKVEAKLNDGVLEVRVPKSEKAQRRRIQITK